MGLSAALDQLAMQLAGDLHRDDTMRRLFSTDASEYQEMPLAVALPRTETDVRRLVTICRASRSLSDSARRRHFARGPSGGSRHRRRPRPPHEPDRRLDRGRARVWVQPGVVRNELNLVLVPHGVFFTPETSTANRAMIGGMVGNNSCGANSIVYGTTREHLVSARGFLSDGSEATFGPLTADGVRRQMRRTGLARDQNLPHRARPARRGEEPPAHPRALPKAHRHPPQHRLRARPADGMQRLSIRHRPNPSIFASFSRARKGTLFLGVEFELNCEPLPPPGALMCAHFVSRPGFTARHAHRHASPAVWLRADRSPHPRVH